MAYSFKVIVFAVAAFAAISNSAVSGACTNVTSMAKVDATKILGNWFPVRGGSFVSFASGQCAKVSFAAKTFTMTLNGIPLTYPYTVSNNVISFNQNIILIATTVKATVWVLDTDYTNYAVFYACGNTTKFGKTTPFDSAMVLSRQSTLATTFNTKIEASLTKNKLNSADLTATFKC